MTAHLSRRAALTAAIAFALPAHAAMPRRIVSLGGATTEILYALGREAEIVGVDATSGFPAQALATKPNVGYLRALAAEGLLSLRPDLVLAQDGAGPPDTLRLVAQAGVRIARIPDDPSEAGVLERIRAIAEATEAGPAGDRLAGEVRTAFASLSAARDRLGAPRVRALVVLSIQNGRPLVAGRGTTGDAILRLAGTENAVGGMVEGWKPLSDEGVIAAAPDALVVLSRGTETPGADPLGLPAFAGTPAARDRRLVRADALTLLGFGPRTPQAAHDLLGELYPEKRRAAEDRR
ncbi:MAG TPA: ABC transporter substrate-binding protein [Salinarimonas sp.]|nr:ABC transporter substrate-binding protein [Salinarimonas sp.]